MKHAGFVANIVMPTLILDEHACLFVNKKRGPWYTGINHLFSLNEFLETLVRIVGEHAV